MNTDELIAGARRSSDALRNAPFKIDRESFADGIDALADALEAATRVPVQGEPNDDREALADMVRDHFRDVVVYDVVDVILAAGFSRATVPDAATERELEAVKEHREKWMARAFRAETERDDALAALDGAPVPGEKVW